MNRTLFPACAACLAFGWLAGHYDAPNLQADPAKKPAIPFPMSARLGSNIYLQRSAEYRACCYQIYKLAEDRLIAALAKADPKQEKKPAVVMDLDETVFDNSSFQTFLYENDFEYNGGLWADYELNYPQDVTLIPGSKEFILKAESLGVAVIYISNRSVAAAKSTASAIERLGLGTANLDSRLLLKPKGGSSDKTSRRAKAEAAYNVLQLFGDNLRDFSEDFISQTLPKTATAADCLKAFQARDLVTDEARKHWGVDWFVLPNPVYGEWDRMIGPDPKALLHPTSMKTKAAAPK